MGLVHTLAGERLDVDVFGARVVVGGAVVLRRDLQASNGWLHGIDDVLLRTRRARMDPLRRA